MNARQEVLKVQREERKAQAGSQQRADSADSVQRQSLKPPSAPSRNPRQAAEKVEGKGAVDMNAEALQAACAEAVRENAMLAKQASTARGEVERQTRAYKELMAASKLRDRHKSAIQRADQQLKQIQGQQSKLHSDRRASAAGRMVVVLEGVCWRSQRLSKNAVISRLREKCAAIRAKDRLAVSTLRAAKTCRLVRAWRTLVVADRLERQAAAHLEQRMREQRQLALAAAHWDQRRARRIWFAWRWFQRRSRRERMEEMVRLRTEQFMQEEVAQQAANESALEQNPEEASGSDAGADDCPTSGAPSAPASKGQIPGDIHYSPAPSRLTTPTKAPCQVRESSVEKLSSSAVAESRPSGLPLVPKRRISLGTEATETHAAPRTGSDAGASGSGDNEAKKLEEQRSTPKRCVDLRRPEMLVKMERRAKERRQAREERLQRQRQREEQQQQQEQEQAAQSHASPVQNRRRSEGDQVVEGSAVRHSEVRRSKAVIEMERRGLERQRVWQERQQWHKLKEEQRLAEKEAAEEARRVEEEEEKKRQIQERRDCKRAEQRKQAQKLVAIAQQREHARQATEFWMRNRLIDVWCALRQLVIESDEMQVAAWCCYRHSLQRAAFTSWKHALHQGRSAREACYIARARLAEWYSRRHAFRALMAFFRLLVQRREWQVATARKLLLQRRERTGVARWHSTAAEWAFEKRCLALRHYAIALSRRAFQWWLAGVRQSKLDAELEFHKEALHKKVSGWLQEIDISRPLLRQSISAGA
jgi:hypothetical protein